MTVRLPLRLPSALALVYALSVLPLGAAAAKPAAQEKDSAKGRSFFRMDKIKSTFAHTCGFRTRDLSRGETQRVVILSSVPVDCAAADKEIDPEEALETAITDQKGAYTTLTVSEDGERIDGTWRSTEPSDAFSFGGQGVVEITKSEGSRLEGRYRTLKAESFFDKTYEFDLRFAVDLLAGSLSGTALPKGGGEPGKVLVAYFKAVANDDQAALQKVVTKERSDEIEGWASGGAFKEVFEGQKTQELRLYTITGGLLQEGRAILEVAGTNYDGEKVRGSILLFQEGGAWKVGERKLGPTYD